MENHNALFLVGGPGSGKDFLLRTALKESGANEIALSKLISAIQTNQNLAEVNGDALIVNGNADDGQNILLAKAVLEAMGYSTAMVFVYTDAPASHIRSKIVESKRVSRYEQSIENMHSFKELFGEGFFLFDNSSDFVKANEETQAQTISWLQELTGLVEGYFEKPVAGIRAPKVPKPVGGEPQGGHPVPAGHERVKQGSFYVIRKKKDVKEDVDILFEKEFPTIVDMIAQKKVKGQSQGDKYKGGIAVPGAKDTSREIVTSEGSQNVSVPQTQAKGVKFSKKRPAKGAKPPGDTFDSRLGTVPSGGIGLTGYKVD